MILHRLTHDVDVTLDLFGLHGPAVGAGQESREDFTGVGLIAARVAGETAEVFDEEGRPATIVGS